MGYYSNVMVSVTMKDYLAMLNKDKRNNNICNYILDFDNGYVEQYKDNEKECILIRLQNFKYYKQFEEIQQFEKYLKKAKDGYIFFRIGEELGDIEYRDLSKIKELEYPFSFIKDIREAEKRKEKMEEEEFE